MIKKEELTLLIMSNNLEECETYAFRNIEHVGETVLVLTDKKIKAPKLKNIKTYYHPWEDNYSAPLNYGLTKCAKKWILRLDSDEYIEPFYFSTLYKEVNSEMYDYYLMNRLSFQESPYGKSFNNDNVPCRMGTIIRLWKNNIKIRFNGLVHEHILPNLQEEKLRGGILNNIQIYHFGEIGTNKDVVSEGNEKYREKANYYYLLAVKQRELTPNDPRVHNHISDYHYCFKRYKEALESIERACCCCAPDMLFKYLAKKEDILRKLKKKEKIRLGDIDHEQKK